MPAVINHMAVLLLARRRLANIRDALSNKIGSGATVSDLEHRLHHLADKAYNLLSINGDDTSGIEYPSPDGTSYSTPLGQGISKYAVMGSMGPDLAGFSAALAPGQGWVFDTVHKGNPDHNRETVVARTCDFPLEIWQQVKPRIEGRTTDNPQEATTLQNRKDADKEKMRAYVLGHLTHVIADVITHPYVNDIEWHLGTDGRDEVSHADAEGHMDAKIAQQVFRRESTRDGQDWDVWWPDPKEVPTEFFAAYETAFKEIYYESSARPPGFGHFEKMFLEHGPPTLDAEFVEDGYSFLKEAVIDMAYSWNRGNWWGFLLPAVIPMCALFPLAMALPAGKQFRKFGIKELGEKYEAENRTDLERAYFEVFMLPFAVTSVIPLFYGAYIASLTRKGVEGITWAGITFSAINVALSIAFFATLGVDDLPWWFRWLIMFLIPAGSTLGFSVYWLTNFGEGEGRRKWLAFIYALPFIVALIFSIIFLCLVMAIPGDVGEVFYWILLILVSGATFVLSFFVMGWIRDGRIPEEPEAFAVDNKHYVRLFDEASLYHDPEADPLTLKNRCYPSGTRELVKLWWDGSGEMWVRSRRTFVEFAFKENPAEHEIQRIYNPISPTTTEDYIAYLGRTVKDEGDATGHLKGALTYNDDLKYDLPLGATFADEADRYEASDPDSHDIENAEDHGKRALVFTKLKDNADDADYNLRHAPQLAQAVRYAATGPVPYSQHENLAVEGPGDIGSSGTTVTGDGTCFRSLFSPGDRIQAEDDQIRKVTFIRSDTELVIESPFSPELDSGTDYKRFDDGHEFRHGYTYITDPSTQHLGGDALMDYAVDLSAMACMGAVPHLVPEPQLNVESLRNKKSGGVDISQNVTKVYQVFRNWNLDRRRVNEWHMLVSGGAVNEKGDSPTNFDAAMYKFPTEPDGWGARDAKFTDHAADGDRISRQKGWVPLMRDWLSIAAKSAGHDFNVVDPARQDAGADEPNNQELSRAMAFLFDMSDPVAID